MINISLFWYMFIIYQYSCIFSDFDEDIVFVSSVLCNGDQLSWLRTNSLLTLNTTLSLMTCDNSREISQEYQPWNCTDISLYYNHNGIGEQQICHLPQISWPSGTVSDRFVVCHRSRDLLEQWQIRSFKSYSRNLLRACIARITVSLYSMNFLTNTFPKTKPWTLTSCFMCAHAFIDQFHNYVVVKILIHLFIYDGNKSPIIVFFFY